MTKALSIACTAVCAVVVSGCAEVGNFFVPPHNKSDAVEPSKSCLYLNPQKHLTQYSEDGKKQVLSIAGMAASAAVGFLVDRTAAAINDESKRYHASYSARTEAVLSRRDEVSGKVEFTSYDLIFRRYLAANGEGLSSKSCLELNSKPEPIAMEVKGELSVNPSKSVNPPQSLNSMLFKLTQITLNKTKAKVASPRWFVPWSWWMFMDRSSQKVDLKATIAVNGLIPTDEGIQSKDILAVDLPLGKFDLDKKIQETHLEDVSSGKFSIPSIKCSGPCDLNAIVTITVTESNDLGDVIGDAAKKVTENKQSVVKFVLEQVKLGAPTSSNEK